MGAPASGRPFSADGVTIFRFADGRVAERWTSLEMLGLLTQIGALLGPGQGILRQRGT